jgi:hypothetical protein
MSFGQWWYAAGILFMVLFFILIVLDTWRRNRRD